MLVALLLLQRLWNAALVDLLRQSLIQGWMLALCNYLNRIAQVTSLRIRWQSVLCLAVECLIIDRERRLMVPRVNILKLPHHAHLVIDSLSLTVVASCPCFQLLLLQ